MEISFKDQVVLIAGSSDGIGLAIAKAFGRDGAKVAICGRSQAKLTQAAESLRAQSIEVFAQSCDVTIFDQFRSFADGAEAALGPINIFINNVGCFPFCQITAYSVMAILASGVSSAVSSRRIILSASLCI